MIARWRWPLAIAGLLVVNVIAMVILMVAAHRDAPQIVPGYDKATQYGGRGAR